ncbi:IS3 family transposase [Metabacillus sediminilitoris]
MQYYNQIRIQQKLNYLSPIDFLFYRFYLLCQRNSFI